MNILQSSPPPPPFPEISNHRPATVATESEGRTLWPGSVRGACAAFLTHPLILFPSGADNGEEEAVTARRGGEGRSRRQEFRPAPPPPFRGTARLPRPAALPGAESAAGRPRGGADGRGGRAGGGAVTPPVPWPRGHVPAPQPIAWRRCLGSEEAVVRDGRRPEMFSSLASVAFLAAAVETETTATATQRHSFRG